MHKYLEVILETISIETAWLSQLYVCASFIRTLHTFLVVGFFPGADSHSASAVCVCVCARLRSRPHCVLSRMRYTAIHRRCSARPDPVLQSSLNDTLRCELAQANARTHMPAPFNYCFRFATYKYTRFTCAHTHTHTHLVIV